MGCGGRGVGRAGTAAAWTGTGQEFGASESGQIVMSDVNDDDDDRTSCF